MRFSFYLPTREPMSSPEAITAIVQRAEQLGFDSAMIGDHVVFPVKVDSHYPHTASGAFPGGGDALELFSLMAFVAARTTRLRLTSSVLILPQRNPLVSAKALATIDHLSGGRLTAGIGVGWMREELEALGVASFAKRGRIADEYLQILKLAWTTDPASFEGKYYRFAPLHCLPLPVQKPHPPIWIGGVSPPALRRVARFGDGWHPVGGNPRVPLPPEEFLPMRDRVFRLLEAEGRDPSSLTISYKVPTSDPTLHAFYAKHAARPPFSGSVEQVVEDVIAYGKLGIHELGFDPRMHSLEASLERMDRFGEVIRLVRSA